LTKKAELRDSEDEIPTNISHCSPLAWEKLGIDSTREDELIQLLQTEYMKAETFLNMARGE
jgi:hypothetical protein